MKYIEAKTTLQHALDNQSTIRISKLKELMAALSIILDPSECTSDSKEVRFLKTENRVLNHHIRKIKGLR
jgi:hypothetical protein